MDCWVPAIQSTVTVRGLLSPSSLLILAAYFPATIVAPMVKVALVALHVAAARTSTSCVTVLVRATLQDAPEVNLVPLSETVVPFLLMFSNLGLLS